MAAEIELSIAETNKLRAQLGLPLIPVSEGKEEKSPERDPSELTIEQTNKLRASLGLRQLEDAPPKRKNATPSTAKSAANRVSASQVSADLYKEVDTDAWLEGLGKGKMSTKKPETILAQDDDEPQVEVAHDAQVLAEVADGDVFTLEDSDLLGEGNDVLSNEKLAKVSKQKQDETERKKIDRLRFGAKVSFESDDDMESSGPVVIRGTSIDISEKPDSPLMSIHTVSTPLFQDEPVEEKTGPVKMKKLKMKKPKQKRKAIDDSIKVTEPMVTQTLLEEEPEDAEELEAILSASRDKKVKRRKLMSAEEIAHEVSLHSRLDTVDKIDGIVYDSTKDFLDTLSAEKEAREEKGNAKEIEEEVEKVEGKEEVENENHQLTNSPHELVSDVEKINEAEVEKSADNELGQKESDDVRSEAKTHTPLNSLSATLQYLRKSNIVPDTNEEQKQAEKKLREARKEAQLMKLQISIEERTLREELEKDSGYKGLPAKEKENTFDRILNQRLIEKGLVSDVNPHSKYSRYEKKPDRLSDYRPQVKLSYKDEKGNLLDRKQAWKQLSHKYHGSAPKHKKESPKAKSELEPREIHPE
ncbi:putative U4/U6-U5 snRNP complex subunit [Clavispora lusitaniae]|uniref:U4/U6-U5 snRNP complex subunit n=1 Tax=Clavispora lusitaniae TaxID=36911 RepID=A0AA91PX84_CLALS|nr:putative U4/U6-U5 snRNP complex subunit [Clavispora lusitaniae]